MRRHACTILSIWLFSLVLLLTSALISHASRRALSMHLVYADQLCAWSESQQLKIDKILYDRRNVSEQMDHTILSLKNRNCLRARTNAHYKLNPMEFSHALVRFRLRAVPVVRFNRKYTFM